jgi:hypothetical protein
MPKELVVSSMAEDTENESEEANETSNKASVKPSDSAFAKVRKIVSLDVGVDDEDWRWQLFPEPTSIEFTPEFDHFALEAYTRYQNDEEEHPKPERTPGISGYDFEKILAEEEEPPEPSTVGGAFGDYLAGRRKLLKWGGTFFQICQDSNMHR